jgi:hypothetical protein
MTPHLGLILATIELSDLFKGVGQFIAIFVATCIPYIKPRVEKWLKKHSDYFTHNLNVRKEINDHLNEIRIRMHADRVCLFEFSNTDKSISQYPFEYLNMTYEKVNVGSVAEIRDHWQKKHINSHVDFLGLFAGQEHRGVIIHSFAHDSGIPESVRLGLQAYNIDSCLIMKIHKELRYGFIAVHFINRQYKQRWDYVGGQHQDEEFLRMKAQQILQLMKSLQ